MDSPDSSTSSGYEYGRNKVLENKGLAISQLTLNAELNEQAYPQYAIKLKETKEQGEVLTLSIRQFEDIQWLYNCLRKGCDKCGIIYPPMPDPPADFIEIDAEENIDRKLGRESKRVTRYLDSLTSHPTLKSCPEIEIFLKEKVLPEKEEEKASLFSKISSLFTSKSSSAFIRDIDDFFELEQIYATKYEQLIRQLNEAHTEVVECLKRLAGQHGHIGACLSMPVDGVSKRGKKMIHIHAQMTSYFKTFKFIGTVVSLYLYVWLLGLLNRASYLFWMELAISSSQVTFGQAAGFYWAYTCNELEMFQRRKDLLIEYQEANATLGKSVGQKREVAAKKQKEVERKLEECSDTARDEIRWFVKKRSKDLLSTVQEYATERSKYEHKILLAIQDSLEELRKAPE